MIYLANNFLDSSLQNHKRQMRPSILFGKAIIQFTCNFEYKLWQLTVLIQAEITQTTRKPYSPPGIAISLLGFFNQPDQLIRLLVIRHWKLHLESIMLFICLLEDTHDYWARNYAPQPATQQWVVIGPTCFTQRPDMGADSGPAADVQLGNWSARYILLKIIKGPRF